MVTTTVKFQLGSRKCLGHPEWPSSYLGTGGEGVLAAPSASGSADWGCQKLGSVERAGTGAAGRLA